MTEDEETGAISIGEIVRRLWRARGIVVSLPLLGLAIGLAIAAWASFVQLRPLTYYISLNNIENSKYPNGSTFQPGDIISRPVLDNLRDRFGISADVDLARNILVTHDSPMASGVETLYRDRLSARNLTQSDIDALNSTFAQQLAATVGKTIRIDVDYHGMGLERSKGTEIALALPIAWTEVYTKQFRTLVSQGLSATMPPVDIAAFQSAAGVLSIYANLDEMRKGLLAVRNDNRLNSVQDGIGATAEDLLQRVDVYAEIYSTPIFASYVGGSSMVSSTYLRDQQLRIDQYSQQISGLDEAIAKLQEFQTNSATVQQMPAGQGAPANVQLDAGALGQIVSLAEKASNAEFLRELLMKRQQATEEISVIRRRLQIARPVEGDQPVTPDFVKQSYDGYRVLAKSYNEILDSARARAEDRSGALYQPLTSPRLDGGLIIVRYLLLAASLAFLGIFFAAVYAIFFARSANRDTDRRLGEHDAAH